ncbi:MAG: hypothetical protein AAFY11_14935, partial [Cyanobacteria bacterium J06641_5]
GRKAKDSLDRIFDGVEKVSSVRLFYVPTAHDQHVTYYRFRASPETIAAFVEVNRLEPLADPERDSTSFAAGGLFFAHLDETPPRWWIEAKDLKGNRILSTKITITSEAYFFYNEETMTAYIIRERL